MSSAGHSNKLLYRSEAKMPLSASVASSDFFWSLRSCLLSGLGVRCELVRLAKRTRAKRRAADPNSQPVSQTRPPDKANPPRLVLPWGISFVGVIGLVLSIPVRVSGRSVGNR